MLGLVRVGAKRVEDLVAWQLGNELRDRVHALTAGGEPAADWKFRSQLRDAVSSVTRNIAEGFGRYRHREFAHFLSIARGSLFEVSDQLRDGVSRQYWTSEAITELLGLCNRTTAALTRLILYLKANPDR